MKNPIYPLAYEIEPGQVQKMYYLAFPESWKKELLEIARKNNPRFKSEYGLPTNALQKLVNSWMEGIVTLKKLTAGSEDVQWLTACEPYTPERLRILCGIIRAWVTATYITPMKVQPHVKAAARNFCDQITPEELEKGCSEKMLCLTGEMRRVNEEAFQMIPLLAVNRLLGKKIWLEGCELHLCYAGKNELVSRPLADPQSRHKYSFVFQFSVQTIPPDRHALLLCHMSIRRWIPGCWDPEKTPYLDEAINAHIVVSEDKYCQVPIQYDGNAKRLDWKEQDKECYNLYGYRTLPEVADIWKQLDGEGGEILLPYKNGMSGFIKSQIGTGVPARDKAALYREVGKYLEGIASFCAEAKAVGGKTIPTLDSPKDYASHEEFRRWVCQCTGTHRITFELCGMRQDERQRPILEEIEKKLWDDFGENTPDSVLNISVVYRNIGQWQAALEGRKIEQSKKIEKALGKAEDVTGSFILLPGADKFAEGTDPKEVLRNGFACSGRVTQFLVPQETEKDSWEHRVEKAVYDLYRQLGIATLLDISKFAKQPLKNVLCVGIHVCTQVHGIAGKGRFLPVFVYLDLQSGKITVQCEAFDQYEVTYREACLEMAKLFWKRDLEDRCVRASRAPFRKILLDLKNRYNSPEKGAVLLVVQADGTSRQLCGGISDKAIAEYEECKEYSPKSLDTGMPKAPFYVSLQDTGMRIVRIRSNMEVPDYYTVLREGDNGENKYKSATGVYQFDKVFWSIAEKAGNDSRYNGSFLKSKINNPGEDFVEKDMIEIYPLQLQTEDKPIEWVRYVNALRRLSIQYSYSTVLPLPLHLAETLSEYLWDI